jgi:hypothetical protein
MPNQPSELASKRRGEFKQQHSYRRRVRPYCSVRLEHDRIMTMAAYASDFELPQALLASEFSLPNVV